MALVKLTYLNYRGRAELLRFILAHASVDFEDLRIEPEKWAEKMPGHGFGIPVLEIEGNVIKTNATIAKFLAEKYKIGGSTADETEAAAAIIDTTEATWDKLSKLFWEKDTAKKAEAMKDLSENYLPATFKKMEVMVMKNGVEKGWIVGQNVTYADFAITVLLDTLAKHKPELLTAFTALAKLKKSVQELPNIEKWIANRPDTSN